MDKKAKTGTEIAAIATKICSLLEPLSSEDRHKVINGSLTMLGEASIGGAPGGGGAGSADSAGGGANSDKVTEGIHTKAAIWMKQNGLNQVHLEQVFHISEITPDGAPLILSNAPGKNGKAQTHNAYVLLGISRFLATGETTVDDKAARKLCEDLGCFANTNHSTYMGDTGKLLTGSRKTGWKLTAPGLKHGANLIKQANGNEG